MERIYLNTKDFGRPLMLTQYSNNIPCKFGIYMENGEPYSYVSGDTFNIEVKIAETEKIITSDEIIVIDNTLSFLLKENLTSIVGDGYFNIVLKNVKNDSRNSSFKRKVAVEPNSIDKNNDNIEYIEVTTDTENVNNTILSSMINTSNKYKLFLNKQVYTQPLILNQYNKNIKYSFEIYNEDGTPYEMDGSDIFKIECLINGKLAYIKSSGFEVYNNIVSFKLDREMTLNAGKGYYNFVVENARNQSRKSTFRTEMYIESSAISENTISDEFMITAKEDLDKSINESVIAKNNLDKSIRNGNVEKIRADVDNNTDNIHVMNLKLNSTNQEVTSARNGHGSLDSRLDSNDSKVKNLENRVSMLENRPIPEPSNQPKYRYVKLTASGNTQTYYYLSVKEIACYNGLNNVAARCSVEAIGAITEGIPSNITNGIDSDNCDVQTNTDPSGRGGFIIDLGAQKLFTVINFKLWAKGEDRKYTDVRLEISKNKSQWTTIYNSSLTGNEFPTTDGKNIIVPGVNLDTFEYNDYVSSKIVNDKPRMINVATYNTWNIGKLNKNEYEGYVGDNLIDIIGLQELKIQPETDIYKVYDLQNFKYLDNPLHMDNGILTRLEVLSYNRYPMPGREEQRYLSNVKVRIKGKVISFYNTHLSYYEPDNRPLQYKFINDKLEEDDTEYKIVVGDFNGLNPEEYKLLNLVSCQGYDGKYYNTNDDDEFKAIDNIFVSENIKIESIKVAPSTFGSDHRMLMAELELN